MGLTSQLFCISFKAVKITALGFKGAEAYELQAVSSSVACQE